MDDKILKHLEFIQNTINRMSTNSFIIKGWTITLIGIILGLNKLEGNYIFQSSYYNFPLEIAIIFFIILLFWFTNTYFLQQERRYIYIYSKTIEQFNSQNNNSLILDMDYKKYANSSNLTDNRRYLYRIITISLYLLGSLFIFFSSYTLFVKIVTLVILFVILAFIITYFIPTKYFCQYLTCLIGRTIISVYGVLIILVLFINHSMFNTVGNKNIEKVKCECIIKNN